MDDRSQKAFEFAQETTKQLLTLSTGIIALTITFSTDVLKQVPSEAKLFLVWAWLAYIVSTIFGIWTLMALTGTLEPKDKSKVPASIRGGNVTIPSTIQILSFLVGIILTVVFGIRAM